MLDPTFLITTIFLALASVYDIKAGKFPNWFFLAACFIGFAWVSYYQSLSQAAISLGIAFLLIACLSPLFFMGAFGAGDIKLLGALSLFINWGPALDTFIYSLFWGLLIGFFKFLVSGNYKNIAQRLKEKNKDFRIPHAVAILLGWFSYYFVGGLL